MFHQCYLVTVKFQGLLLILICWVGSAWMSGWKRRTGRRRKIKKKDTPRLMNGQKFATLSLNKRTRRTHKDVGERNKENLRGFMFEQADSPLCPVALLEKHLSLLLPIALTFYLHPKHPNYTNNVPLASFQSPPTTACEAQRLHDAAWRQEKSDGAEIWIIPAKTTPRRDAEYPRFRHSTFKTHLSGLNT